MSRGIAKSRAILSESPESPTPTVSLGWATSAFRTVDGAEDLAEDKVPANIGTPPTNDWSVGAREAAITPTA